MLFIVNRGNFVDLKITEKIKYRYIFLYIIISFDNMAKRILLSVPDQILKKLEAEKEKYAYTSLQEVILEALRDRLFIEAEPTVETRGRPKKIKEEKILTRKKIFSSKGEPISI